MGISCGPNPELLYRGFEFKYTGLGLRVCWVCESVVDGFDYVLHCAVDYEFRYQFVAHTACASAYNILEEELGIDVAAPLIAQNYDLRFMQRTAALNGVFGLWSSWSNTEMLYRLAQKAGLKGRFRLRGDAGGLVSALTVAASVTKDMVLETVQEFA